MSAPAITGTFTGTFTGTNTGGIPAPSPAPSPAPWGFKMNQNLPDTFSIMWDGQRYSPVALVPHQRVDGTWTTVTSWLTECPRCGEKHLITTGQTFAAPKRFCDKCGTPGRTVKGMRKAFRRDVKNACSP